ncbi:hypothetical protein M758_8G102300 [Ceratodon purpureus]|uniref:Uncharacterized protein n=1 Tax=Ceratodon purpureus TaxID=3225 RepID=A0A8T0GZ90_CERPU|nr:hypothetical protein KC19_8G106200 [Ceratodon purpureus]KAG0608388.1 hypothetical protein M758_8G102300 [Ceratodon purpureus]
MYQLNLIVTMLCVYLEPHWYFLMVLERLKSTTSTGAPLKSTHRRKKFVRLDQLDRVKTQGTTVTHLWSMSKRQQKFSSPRSLYPVKLRRVDRPLHKKYS